MVVGIKEKKEDTTARMTSYHELEKSTYDSVRSKLPKRIPGKSSWKNKEDLPQEASGELRMGQRFWLARHGYRYHPVFNWNHPQLRQTGSTSQYVSKHRRFHSGTYTYLELGECSWETGLGSSQGLQDRGLLHPYLTKKTKNLGIVLCWCDMHIWPTLVMV